MEEYIIDWEECPYAKKTYYEYDTGYSEWGCDLISEVIDKDVYCDELGCPLSFKYKIERNKYEENY